MGLGIKGRADLNRLNKTLKKVKNPVKEYKKKIKGKGLRHSVEDGETVVNYPHLPEMTVSSENRKTRAESQHAKSKKLAERAMDKKRPLWSRMKDWLASAGEAPTYHDY
jgi:hypothetical protein